MTLEKEKIKEKEPFEKCELLEKNEKLQTTIQCERKAEWLATMTITSTFSTKICDFHKNSWVGHWDKVERL